MIIMNRIQVSSPLLMKPFSFRASKPLPPFKCRCTTSSDEEKNVSGNNNLNDALSGIVGSQVEELLSRKENRVLFDGLEKASQRVEIAKSQLAMIEQQELAVKQFKDYIDQLENKASEIAECQREISEAKALVEEAERTLSLNAGGPKDGSAFMGMGSEEIDRDQERLESVKAASISALVGTIAALPICYAQVTDPTQLLLTLAINFISCALFGVTFRYTTRRDLDDVQLKTGVAAAFGVVKGLGTLSGGPLLELNFESFLSHSQDGTIYVSENVFIFVCAAVGLDYCLKTGLLSPFPIDRSV
ncbi:uncharacterized protein LOC130739140 [Lotus japonicus]|uniref:uncharacterized protein LOC130739140 n=1 Tax=Lotus japonicus TaxID=34305 RepID=UPI0025858D67|nr:uncharacterized protein LOC130739140 [Lotus japonicus]